MTDQTSANLLPPRVFPGVFVGLIAMLMIMVHVAVFWWLWGESDNPAPEDQLAEISVEIVASRSLLVPNQAPEQPSDVAPEPEPESEPEPEPKPEPESELEPKPEPEPEPAETASEAAPIEPELIEPVADPEPKPTSEPASEIPPKIPTEAPSIAPSPVEDFSVPIMNATHEADGLDNPVPQYPPAAYFDRLEGTVTLRVKVLPNGRVDDVVINESSGHRILDESARSTISEWNFVPARREGRPITQWVDVPITYQLVEE